VPVTITVDAKRDIEAVLTNKGFKPPVIRIDEGTAIMWKWSACEVPVVISEATYSHSTGKLRPVESEEKYYNTFLYRLRQTFADKNYNLSETFFGYY